ncbi:hypothetical protein QCA50_015018 [Cerrena zonata]|uniref:DUF2470 domain-containing protein n=1 Tax=Cerrena zonata TaxID=2478898 RepID=A0AAW0FSM9_9APHY
MSDEVASKSGFLCMYMSNHPDTLVSYVRYWGKVNDNVTSAQMTSIDTKAMTLTYTVKGSSDKKQVRIEFDPPLAGYEEVKPRLLNMKVDAEEALGMLRAPQITSFHLPFRIWIPTAMVASLVYVTFAPLRSSPSYNALYLLANLTRETVPSWAIPTSWIFMVSVHFLEALYTLYLCRHFTTPFSVGLRYVAAAFIWGFPIIKDLRKRAQDLRIDSIMKGK